jgi:hypothetical protein
MQSGLPVQMLEGPEFITDGGPTPVPEPSMFAMLAVGLAVLKVGRSFRRTVNG